MGRGVRSPVRGRNVGRRGRKLGAGPEKRIGLSEGSDERTGLNVRAKGGVWG